MQEQLTKKLKESLNKSSESYNHLSNQSQGGINNQSLNFNSNVNQNNSNTDLNSQQIQSANYMSNKLKKISQGGNTSENSKQKVDRQTSGADNQQDSQVFNNLTNKLTQNLKDNQIQNGCQAHDISDSIEFISRIKEFREAQHSGNQADQSDTLEQKYNQCQRLDTELNDNDDPQDYDDEIDNELILQKEFEELIQYERRKQEQRIHQQHSQDQDSLSHISDQHQAQQIQEQQQFIIQQQYLASLQPGDFRIEIENRFLKSDCNRNFQFPRKNLRNNVIKYDYDTDGQSSNNSSLLSVEGITVYNLHGQNMKNYQREYMQMQEQMNEQMEKFKAQEQLRLEKEEEEIIEKERQQHQLRQQKMVQQQMYIQHSYEKQSQERKNEQIQQLRQQFQQQQQQQIKLPCNNNINLSSQIVRTEAYDSDSVGRNTLTQNGKNQKPIQTKNQNVFKSKLEDNQNINQSNNNNSSSNKKAQLQQKQQQLLFQGMKDSLSAEKQNSSKQQQLQKFKNILMNKQQNIQNQSKNQNNGNARRMKTEGNDIDYDQQNINNQQHHLHTQHNYQHEDGEEDETIENFELALQDDSDNDSGEVARLDDIKIQSYKQTASPPKSNNNKSFNNQISKSQNLNQEGSNSKNYKNIMEILEKNSKTTHSRQSKSISNSNQMANSISSNNNYKKSSTQSSTHQTLQLQIIQAAAAAAVAAASTNSNSITKNSTYKSRPTTSQSNYYKNLYSSQNCSINNNPQQSSNRNTLQPQENNNISKVRQSSKTSHSNYDGNSTIQIGTNHVKKPSANYLNQSIENFSSKQPSINQTLQNQINPTQDHNSRKRSNSNKNNNSISVTSSIPNQNKFGMNQNSQKPNISSSISYSKQLENFKVDNIKNSTLKQRDEKAPSKAPTGQQAIMNLLSTGSYMNNTNNSFQVAKNISMNQGISNKVNSQSYQNAAKLKGRNANSFHQNVQSSNISSIQTSQTTNLNNKSTIVSNYSINSNSKKKLLSSSSSSNLINAPQSINNQLKNDQKVKSSLQNNQISTIINANININNLNPTNYSKVRVSTNSNVRDSIQSQKGNALNSRVQTEPSNNDDDFDFNYLNNRLNTLQKIPSKQSLLNNKSSSRRKDNSSSKTNLRDQQFTQQQTQNYQHQKQQQIGQNQALQSLMINNSYNLQLKSEENTLSQGQQIPSNQVKYTDNLAKPLLNQQNIIHSNLRSTNEQSTSDLNDQNRLSGQSFDQIQKIRDYLKQKQSKYPTKQSNQATVNAPQYQMNGSNNQPAQYSYQQQQQTLQKDHHNNTNQQPQIYINNLGQQQQQQQHHLYQNFNQKSENQQFNQQNSQFNSSALGQNNNQSYFQKQIR